MFSENFQNNNNGWLEKSNPDVYMRVANGTYTISNESSSWCASWNYFNCSKQNNFRIVTRLKCCYTSLTSGFGIIWGVRDIDNFVSFQISSDLRSYQFSECKNGKWNYRNRSRLRFRALPYAPLVIELSVRENGRFVSADIKDYRYHFMDPPPFDLNGGIGFICPGHTRIEVYSLFLPDCEPKLNHSNKKAGHVSYFEDEKFFPKEYIKSDGKVTTDYFEWRQDYDEGGYLQDEDYFIYGFDHDD
ncbi:MAG: hypothetical protein GX142_01275 [Chloroflexi bacterium]|nr:hypothetical protein [Chloroflexota bacterium]